MAIIDRPRVTATALANAARRRPAIEAQEISYPDRWGVKSGIAHSICVGALGAALLSAPPGARAAGAPAPASFSSQGNALVSGLAGVSQAPEVTLAQPPARSNDTTPSFTGTAGGAASVTVTLYRGASVLGGPVRTLKATPAEGVWVSPSVYPPLEDGVYTALAREPGAAGEGEGTSDPASFEVDTQPPVVTLRGPPSPSADATPSFSGLESEASEVTVEVFAGGHAGGRIVATALAPGTGGEWISGDLDPELESGTYTAVALASSAIGNAPGESAPVTFVVDTRAPTVALDPVASPTANATPSFSGTASETTQVSVSVYAGPVVSGIPVAGAIAQGTGGEWTSGPAAPALEEGTYTAVATQRSAVSGLLGESAPVTFTVQTGVPHVTLDALPTPSADRAPSFTGTASDPREPVVVSIYRGGAAEGPVASSAEAEGTGGAFSSEAASPPLEWGEYTALATQRSSLGNPTGTSAPVSFQVEPIPPRAATEAAAEVARTSAAMYASIEPQAAGVSACYFEYGTTPAYGRSIECGFLQGLLAFPPAATVPVPVFARIYGLSPGATYHFRIVAAGEGGGAAGADAQFTTLPPWQFNEGGGAGGAAKASGGVLGTSASSIEPLIAGQLSRYQRTAKRMLLLRRGMFKALFRVPLPGKAAIEWSYKPASDARTHRRASSPVLVASGSRNYHEAGSATLEVHLTAAGRRLLRRSKALRLGATCTFAPLGGSAVRASRAFELKG